MILIILYIPTSKGNKIIYVTSAHTCDVTPNNQLTWIGSI